MVVGERVQHQVDIRYRPFWQIFTVRIDGKVAYRRWGLLPWASKRPREFRSAAPEVHFYLVEPPGWFDPIGRILLTEYQLWLDGQRVLTMGPARQPTSPQLALTSPAQRASKA